MTYVADRFGLPPVVTKQQLAAMAPHMRSECVALMREAGLTIEQIARPLQIRPETVAVIADACHGFKLPKLAADVAIEEEQDEPVPSAADLLSRHARAILKYAARNGLEIFLSKDDLAVELGIGVHLVDVNMTTLVDGGHLTRLRPGSGARPPRFGVTQSGEALIAEIGG